MDAGGHGIFDFIHRDPATMQPYLSTSRTNPPGHVLRLGGWQFPLSGGEVELLRRGRAFWEILEEHGIPTTILRIPANFPPSGTASRELSGMGTPDILGGYGTFSYYTTDRLAFLGQTIAGGNVYRVEEVDGVVRAQIHGPDHPLKISPEKLVTDFSVALDPDRPAVKLTVGDEVRLLEEGDWSDWCRSRSTCCRPSPCPRHVAAAPSDQAPLFFMLSSSLVWRPISPSRRPRRDTDDGLVAA